MNHGTRRVVEDGRLTAIIDRTGATHATLRWRGDALDALEVAGARIDGAVIVDPLLGAAHAIVVDGRVVTTVSALDWRRPREVPAIAAPAALPAGAGTPILNTIAVLAQLAEVPTLRYAGPYPTTALWTTLQRSFHTAATEREFTADLLARAARLARDPIAIDLIPAPHEQLAIPHGHVELRAGVERVVLDGTGYVQGGSPARLTTDRTTGEVHAELWFGDARWSRVATVSADGTLTDGPHAITRCTSAVVGQAFPPALATALAELIASALPAPLAGGAAEVLRCRTLRWADLGARAAAADATSLAVHAALWERVAPHGMGRLALALVEALAPVVATAVVAQLAATTAATR